MKKICIAILVSLIFVSYAFALRPHWYPEPAVGEIENSRLTSEEVQDYIDALIGDTDSVHTRITITYDDDDDTLDFVVDDMNDDQPDDDSEVPDAITINPVNAATEAAIEAVVDHDDLQGYAAGEHFTMLDEDDFATDSNTQAATQQSIKAYISSQKLFDEIVQAATDTLTVSELRNTIINNYGQSAANTQTLPTAAEGMSAKFVIAITGQGAFHIKAGATDKIYLNKSFDTVILDDGDKVSCATPAIGNHISFWTFQTGAAAWDWIAVCGNGVWLDGGP